MQTYLPFYFTLSIEMNGGASDLLQTKKQKVRDAFQKSQLDVLEYVDSIKKWFGTQPHLPEVPSDQLIESFLVTNKYSIEKTKEKLGMYYTIRTLLPECFQNKNPKLPHMQKMSKNVYYCPLPKLTEKLFRVNVTKLRGDPSEFDTYNFFGYQMNINEIKLHEDLNLGDILILDLEHMQKGHLFKFSPIHIKKADTILQKVFSNRIKEIHIINYPAFVDTLMVILKSVLKHKMINRIHLHSSLESLIEYIPTDVLPKDYGGDEMSLNELHELWTLKLEQYQNRFDTLEALTVKEELRPRKLVNDDILGYYGNFKKLEVD